MRAMFEKLYKTEEGRIIEGPFSGEMLYVPYLWQHGEMNTEDGVSRIYNIWVTVRDRMLFPELGEKTEVKLHMDEDGQVFEISPGTVLSPDMVAKEAPEPEQPRLRLIRKEEGDGV